MKTELKSRPRSFSTKSQPPVKDRRAKYKLNHIGCGTNNYKYNQLVVESHGIKCSSESLRGGRADIFFILKYKNLAMSLTINSIQPNAQRTRLELGNNANQRVMARARKQRKRLCNNAGSSVAHKERDRMLVFDFSQESVQHLRFKIQNLKLHLQRISFRPGKS